MTTDKLMTLANHVDAILRADKDRLAAWNAVEAIARAYVAFDWTFGGEDMEDSFLAAQLAAHEAENAYCSLLSVRF